MIEVLINSLPIFVAIGLGKLFVYKKWLPYEASKVVSSIAFKIVGPLFIFNVLHNISIEPEHFYFVIIPVVVFFVVLLVSYLAGRYIFKLSHGQIGAVVLCLISSGAGSVYPFVHSNFPEETFKNFVIVGTFSFLIFLVGGSLVAFKLGRETKISVRQMILRFIKDPFLVSIVLTLAIALSGIKVPSFLVEISEFFTPSFFFLISLFIGMVLKVPDKSLLMRVLAIYIFRVVVIVCLITLFSVVFSLNKSEIQPFYLVFLAQYAVLAVAYAKEQELDYEFASQLVLFSMVAQLVIYPFVIYLLL